MKKLLLAVSIVSALVSVSVAQAASTGTINFSGLLTASTCNATVNGSGPTATVVLPTVGIDQLQTAGLTQGRTGFDINLAGCTGSVQKTASAYFEAGQNVDVGTGRLTNSSTGETSATNVELQLLDGLGSQAVIQAGNANQQTNTTYVDTSKGSATLPYLVQYYSTGAAGAGIVASSVVYSLQYK